MKAFAYLFIFIFCIGMASSIDIGTTEVRGIDVSPTVTTTTTTFNNNSANVNVSEYWDTLDTFNSTQMEDSGGFLNILESWINTLTSAGFGDIFVNETGDTMTGDLNMSNNSIIEVDVLQVHNITGRSEIIFGSTINLSGFNITGFEAILGTGKYLTDINTTGFGRRGFADYLYNDTLSIFFNETKLNSTIDLKTGSTTYYPWNITTIAGTWDDGNVTNIWTANEGYTYNVSEDSGSPAMTIVINFSGVNDFNSIIMREWYQGGAGHEIEIGLLDCTSGIFEEEYGDITDMDEYAFSIVNVLDPADHICNGDNVSLRLRHSQAGNPAHDYVLDYATLVDGSSTIVTTQHDSLSGRDDIENHPWAFDTAGTRNITGNLTILGSYLQMYNHTITVAKRGGDYTKVQDAINSVTDATTNNKYAIIIHPGRYEENVVAKSNVYIFGIGGILGQPEIYAESGTVYSSPTTFGLTGLTNVELFLNASSDEDVLVNISAGINGMDSVFLNVLSESAGVTPTLMALSGGVSVGILTNSYLQYIMRGSDTAVNNYVVIKQQDTSALDLYNVQFVVTIPDINDTIIIFNESGKSVAPTRLSSNGFTITLSNTSYTGTTIFYNSEGANTDKDITANIIKLTSSGGGKGIVYNVDTASSDGHVESSFNTIEVTGFKNNYYANLGTEEILDTHYDNVDAENKTTGDTKNFNYVYTDEHGQLTLSHRLGVGLNSPLSEVHINDSDNDGFALYWATSAKTGSDSIFKGTYFGVNQGGESVLVSGGNFSMTTNLDSITNSFKFHYGRDGNAFFPANLTLNHTLNASGNVRGYELKSRENMSINFDGPDGDAYLNFWDGGTSNGKYLAYDDIAGADINSHGEEKFEMNAPLGVLGTVTASGNLNSSGEIHSSGLMKSGGQIRADDDIYIDYEENSPNKFLYFSSLGSPTAEYIQFSESFGTFFTITDTLVISGGQLQVGTLTAVGSDPLCWDGSGVSLIGDCSSLTEYKKNIQDLTLGLDTVMLLEPKTFYWKQSNEDGSVIGDELSLATSNNISSQQDIGFLAEDVFAVDPLLTTIRDGELTGVRYNKLNAVLVNAIQELKAENDLIKAELCKKDNTYSWCV